MKVDSCVIKAVLRDRKKADGTQPITIRACFHGRAVKTLPISVEAKYWDKDKECVKKSCPNSAMINKIINDEKQKIIQRKLDYEAKGVAYTAKDLMEERVVINSSIASIYQAMKEERGLSLNNHKVYCLTFKLLAEYYKNENLNITTITGDNIQGFCKWMSTTKNTTDTTVQSVCKRIAALYRYAIDKGIVAEETFIFKKWKYWKIYKAKEEPMALTTEQFENFRAYWSRFFSIADIDGSMIINNPNYFYVKSKEEYATTLFLASFYCQGLAMCDLAELKASQLKVKNATRKVVKQEFVQIDYKGEKRTAYVPMEVEEDYKYWEVVDVQRQKTRQKVLMVIEITQETWMIFQPYILTADTRNGYVFPIYNNDNMTEKQKLTILNTTRGVVNKTLKKVAEKINEQAHRYRIENSIDDDWVDIPSLHFYAARHTFASIMAAKGVSNANIATMLGRTIQNIDTYIHSIQSTEQLLNVKSKV